MSIPSSWHVEPMTSSVGKAFLRENHYSHSCHNGPMCWGLYDGDTLLGVCAFATPGSENVRASVFGKNHVNNVTELHRLFIIDDTPKNAESWFISRALKGLKEYRPHIWAVISFADSTQGHMGTIYQATNALYTGTTSRARFYRDEEGRLRHPRQSGHNVTLEEAAEKGWKPEMREAKHRYLFLLGDGPAHRRELRKKIKFNSLPYPNKDTTEN